MKKILITLLLTLPFIGFGQKKLMKSVDIKFDRIYENDFLWGTKDDSKNFKLCVYYQKYEFIPNQKILVETCKGKLNILLRNQPEYLNNQNKDIVIEIKTKRNGLTGKTGCLVCGTVFLTPESTI